MKNLHKNLRIFVLAIFFLVLILNMKNISSTQLTFDLDLNNPIFQYYENNFNDSTDNIIFNTSQNVTLYITIAKNSTILYSDMNLTGKISPSQTYASGYMSYSVAVGNVTDESQIVVGKYNSVILLNSSLQNIWNFTTNAGQTYRVAIGDLTSSYGREVAVACQESPFVYLLNSSGNQIWTYSDRGEAKSVAIGDVTSDSKNEVVVGAGSYVDVLNSTSNVKWTYNTIGTVYSLAIGDVTTDTGNEIAVGDNSRVYLLNSSGNITWNSTIGRAIYGIAIGDINSDSGNEIVAGADNGTVYVLNSTGDVKWTYNIGDKIYDVVTGDVTSDSRNEIAIGSKDNNVYVLNSSGSYIWSYTTGDEIHGVAIGNITNDPLNETVTVSIDNYVYILNFEYYPTNPYLDVGDDGDKDWSYSGKLRVSNRTDNSSITPEIQDYLNNICTTPSCDVPFLFHSDAAGDLEISNINITYDYDASDTISYSNLSNTWSRTNDTYANESIGNEVKNITYGTPGTTVHVNDIRINDTATACDFNGQQGSTTTSDGKTYCDLSSNGMDYDITAGSSDYLWDNNMSSSVAIYINESVQVTENSYWKKNVTVWNVTDTIFYGVIGNTTLNESVVNSNETLRVYWNGSWCDITPSSEQSDCDTTNNPSIQKSCDSDTFYVCKKDTSGTGIINYFKWKQPHTSETIYEVSGNVNHESNLTDGNVTPSSGIWGREFNFTINVTDGDGDNVTVNLWIYLDNFGTWIMMGSKNTTEDTTSPVTLLFNVTSNKSWVGNNKYKFEYRDFNSTGFIYHGWQNTSNYTGPYVQKHNVSIIHESGNDTSINKGSGIPLIIRVNDTDNSTIVGEGVSCMFWITTDGINFDSGHSSQTNSSGYCNYTFIPDSTYSAEKQWWRAGVYSDTYYQNQNSTNFTVFIYGQVSINLTDSVVNRNLTRGQTISLEAYLYDEYNNTVSEPGFNCTWYVNNSLLGNSITNSSGYCNYTWTTNCSNYVDFYLINVTLWNSTFSYYNIQNNESFTTIALKDNLNLNIINPVDGYIIHEQEMIVLNSSVSDGCTGIPTQDYTVKWYFKESGSCPTGNPVTTGDNTTWNLNATCTPRQQNVIANASGELYYTGNDSVSIYIYGWSIVQIIYPTGDGTINRSDPAIGNYVNVFCRVNDSITGGLTPQNYPVKFWYDQNYIGENTTNSSGIAIHNWNITNETVPDGFYDVRCNITNISTTPDLYYNTSIPESNASNVRILGDPDIFPPEILWVQADSVLEGNNVTIEAYVKDFYSIDKVWINITNSTTSTVYLMQNTSTVVYEGIWNISFNLTKGDYDFTIYANDTSGNGPNSTTSWFEVFLPIQFYGNTKDSLNNNVSVDFIFYRNGTNYIIHQFSTNSSDSFYNETVHNRTYDIDVKAYNHTVKFISVIMNQNTVNSVSNISTFSTSVYNIIGVRNYLKKFMIKSTLNYSSINITFNYSDVFDFYNDPGYPYTFREEDIDVYRCGNFTIIDVATWNCSDSGGWTNLNTNPNQVAHTIKVNISTLSGFIIGDTADPNDGACDRGETCEYDTTCCGSPPTTVTGGTSPGGGGSTTGISPDCGNGECEAGENIYNCPEDCGSPEGAFSLRTNLTDVQLDPGQQKNYALWISNNIKYKINASVSIVGTASDFVTLDKTLLDVDSDTEVMDKLSVNIPNNAEPGTYTGQIYVTAEGKTQRLPFTITISMKAATNLEITVETKNLNKEVDINGTAKFQIFLYNLGFRKKFDVDLDYLIKEFQTEKMIYNESETKHIESTQTYIKSIHLSNVNITPGHYLFEVYAFYEGKNTSSTDDFYVVAIFWTTSRIILIGLLVTITVSIISVYYGRQRYILWKQSKARYIFPIDMKKLPKGDIWLGKIAETNTKAYFNMNDLTTHVLTAGATGSGKSVSASIFVEELLEKKIPVIVFDPTAQWTGFVRPCRDGNLIRYYKEFRMSVRDTKPYTGMIYEVTDPNVKIDFKKYMNPGEITVFTLNKLKPGQYDEAVTNIIDTIFNQGWEESTKIKMVIVFDEVHRLLEKYGGKGGYVALERACREFRKWGIGLIMASQVLSDFKEAIKGNVLTEIQLHTKSLGDLGRIEKKYGLEYAKKVTREEVGVGMMQNPKYNEGRPWFITFRPTYHSPHKISDDEMNTYRKYAAILADVESRIEAMEKSGVDVFDLKTELKLAKDKLKKGRFRMAKIYIDSLTKHLNEG